MDVGRMKRHFDGLIRVVERARARGIRILCGTDTGNNAFMPFGELHAKELEIFVTYCGFTPMEALVAATRGNAFAVGLEGDLGVLEAGEAGGHHRAPARSARRHPGAGRRPRARVRHQGRHGRAPRRPRPGAESARPRVTRSQREHPTRRARRRDQRDVPSSGLAGRHVTEARRMSHVPQHQDRFITSRRRPPTTRFARRPCNSSASSAASPAHRGPARSPSPAPSIRWRTSRASCSTRS